MKKLITAIACILCATIGLAAQDKPKPSKLPKLEPVVAADLRDKKIALLKSVVEEQGEELQAMRAQLNAQSIRSRVNEENSALNSAISSALERSHVDAKKYSLNPDTLEVFEPPTPPSPPKK